MRAVRGLWVVMCVMACLVIGAADVAQAEVLAYDGFCPVSSNSPESVADFGWSGPWQSEAGTVSVTPWDATLSDVACFDHHVALSGNSRVSRLLDVRARGAFDKAGLVEEGRIGRAGKTLYVGFLQRISHVPAQDPALPGYLRYYALEFKSGPGDERRNLEIGYDDRSNPGQAACYGAASVVNNSRTDTEPGQFQSLGPDDTQVNMIVVKFTFGANGCDTVEIYRNPASRTDEGAATVTATLHGDFRFDRIALARFVGNAPTLGIDELCCGTRYADVFTPVDDRTREAARLRAESQVARAADAFRQKIVAAADQGVDVSECQRRFEDIVASAGRVSPRERLTEIAALRAQMAVCEIGRRVDRLLFVKRHAFQPSHIYTEYSDGPYRPGGGIFVLAPVSPQGTVTRIFDAQGGICRDPEVSFDGRRILFSYRSSQDDFYHVYEMDTDGSNLHQLTDGPFHDLDPFYLADGRIGMTSTRCKSRALCFWVQAATLFVMEADGRDPRPLTANNVNEFTPDLLPDGRLLYTRWEYMDKSAIFVQALWSVLPDGTQARQVFGNNLIHPVSMLQARGIPGTKRILCTLAAHNGNSYGPLAVIDPARGVNNPDAILNLAPEVNYGRGCFAPYPLDEHWSLVSYGPDEPFGLWLFAINPSAGEITPGLAEHPLQDDQFPLNLGSYWASATSERHLIYRDSEYSCVEAIPIAPRSRPPVPASLKTRVDAAGSSPTATVVLADVYRGLEDTVPRGLIKHLQIIEEMGERDAVGSRNYESGVTESAFIGRYGSFMNLYAAPWEQGKPAPSLQAKHVYGTVPVEADGSAYFIVPAERPLYFQVLDENYNEIQRMRSYIDLKRDERVSCIGCHESRGTAPPCDAPEMLAVLRGPSQIEPPPFGAGPFAYQRLVQPIFDRHCTTCHGSDQPAGGVDLSARRDARGVPASFATIVRPRTNPDRPPLVNFFDSWWGESWTVPVARPLTFGAAVSPLVKLIDTAHEDAAMSGDERVQLQLSAAERRILTTWISLNCPLWDNYSPELHVSDNK